MTKGSLVPPRSAAGSRRPPTTSTDSVPPLPEQEPAGLDGYAPCAPMQTRHTNSKPWLIANDGDGSLSQCCV
jgi:hypothetical protein